MNLQRQRKLVGGALVALLTLIMGAAVVSAPAQAAGSSLDIARGVVTSNGSPVSGAVVQAFIWPNGETSAALPIGSSIDMFPLPNTTTDASGHYFVQMSSPGSIPDKYKEPGTGAVSIEVDVIESGKVMVTGNSVNYDSVAGAWEDAETGDAVPAGGATEAMDFGTGMATDMAAPAGDDSGTPVATEVSPYAGGSGCGWVVTGRNLGQPEHFLNVNSWRYGKGMVVEGSTSSHTLGWGVSGDGKFSDLKFGGRITLSLTSGTGNKVWASGLVNQSVSNRVNSSDSRMYCGGSPTNNIRRRVTDTYAFLDSTLQHDINHTAFFSSVQGVSVGGWNTTSAHSATMGSGLDLGPISVSAQSGFDKGTVLEFNITKPGFIGGSSVNGPHQSARVDSRSYR